MKRLLITFCAASALMLASPFPGAAQQRRPPSGGSSGSSGGSGGATAAPRGGGGGGGQHASPPPSGSGGAARRGDSGGSYGPGTAGQARPRGGGPVYGQAVPRSQFGGRINVPSRYYGYSPWYYYSPYAFGAFGLGYWGWDPYWWGYYPGYWGYPYGYYGGYGRYYGGGYYGGGYYGDGYYREGRDYGSLKLKVKPKEAEVYVDGYYMGQVDDFDGVFKHLDLESGTHKVEIRAEGYQPLVFEMRIQPGRTVKYEGELKR